MRLPRRSTARVASLRAGSLVAAPILLDACEEKARPDKTGLNQRCSPPKSYLHSVIVCIAVSASPSVGYLPSILYFVISLGIAFIVTHFLLDISSMT